MAEFVVFENETADSNKTAVVASFSNGRLKLESESSNNLQFGYFCNTGKSIASREQKLLVAESDKLRYLGRNYGPDAVSAPEMCKYMLGIHDKRTGKVRLVDATLFHLRPSLGESDGSDNESDRHQPEDSGKLMTYAEKQERLILQFGTAKGKRAVKARLRNQVNTEQLEQALNTLATESQESLATIEEPTESVPTVIPPYNKDAEIPEDVYPLDSLISPEEMLALVNPAAAFINVSIQTINQWREDKKYPGYILNQLTILPVHTHVRQLRACQLMYWCYLHRLLHAGNRPDTGRILKDAPLVVRQTLTDRFTIVYSDANDKPLHMMPRRLKDLLRSHMLVLCLVLEEFSFDYGALQKDLDIPLPQLEKCFQALGCKTVRQVSSKETSAGRSVPKSFKATLVVPLKFPVYKAFSGRR